MAEFDEKTIKGKENKNLVLECCSEAYYTEKELAKELNLSITTVRNHLEKLENKLEKIKAPYGFIYKSKFSKSQNIVPSDEKIKEIIRKFIRKNKRVPDAITIICLPEFKFLFRRNQNKKIRLWKHIQALINTVDLIEVEHFAKLK